MDDPSIRFQAEVSKVQTLIDGGVRLTLDLGQVDPSVIVALFNAKQPGILLEVAAVAIHPELQEKNRENGKVPARSEWQP